MPYSRGTIIVQPPIGGISRRTTFQQQPPFSSYGSVNFWPIDAISGRITTATRPRLQLQTTPSETPPRVNMITPVNGSFSGQPFESLVANVKDSLYWWTGTAWQAATGTKAGSVDVDRAIYATPFLSKVYIPVETNKPIVFDYDTGAAEQIVETVGTAPSDCRISATWQGCVWLAGSVASGPHILYASRTGDAEDWDYTVAASDIGGAFFTGGQNEGLLTGPITALMPQTAETMLVSTVDGIMAMRGHPRRGGVFEPISKQQSVLGNGAWAKTPDNVVWFLSKQGLYKVEPNSPVPVAVSREKIPRELIGLTYNYEDPTVCMAYDSMWDVIYITVRDNNQNQSWLFDPRTGGFHQMLMSANPWVMYEHMPFQTESASGVLFGRADGFWRFDIFGNQEDEMSSSIIVGPIQITENPNEIAKVVKLRTIFGRNTPDTDAAGTLIVCGGVDGQDAISRLMNGQHQYQVSIETLKHGNAVVYPHVAGSAIVFALTQSAGDIAIEQFVMDTQPMGMNNQLRTTQIAFSGEPSATIESVDFDALTWEGYSQATPDNAPSTLASFTHWIDLSGLPASWWAKVGPSGGDIRATDGSNNPLAMDLINFDAVTSTGFIAVKHSALTTAQPVRLWVGKSGMAQPLRTATYGRDNAYDSNWIAFWPDGGGTDRTVNANDLTHTNSTAGDSTGTIGVDATDYDEANHGASDSYATKASPGITTGVLTMVAVAKQNNLTDTPGRLCGLGTGTNDNRRMNFQRSGTEGRVVCTEQNTSTGTATTSTSGIAATTYHHCASTFVSTTSRFAYVNGVATQNTTSITAPDAGTFTFVVGRAENPALATTTFQGDVCLLQLHNAVRSSDWVAYQAAMMNQATFWNTWSAFVTVNPGEGDPDLNITACPLGEVPHTESGTWSGYAAATPDPLPSNAEGTTFLPYYSYWIDLSGMPASWWTAVAADGADIRATDSNNIFLPLDLIDFDAASDTGFAVVRHYAATGTAPQIRLWVGNASATAIPNCGAYGRYRAYDQYYQGFWPSAAGADRTQYNNDLTGFGDFIAGGVTGPIGNDATRYDGTDDYSKKTSTTTLPTEPSFTMSIACRVNSPDTFEVSAPFTIAKSSNQHYYGFHTVATTEPYTLVAYGPSVTWKANEKDFTSVDTWNMVTVGFKANDDGGMGARIIVDSTINFYGSFETQFIPKITGLDTLFVGATTRDSTDARIFFDGDLCLASLSSVFRPTVWSIYQSLMLVQGTFWNTWVWTASSSSLTQP